MEKEAKLVVFEIMVRVAVDKNENPEIEEDAAIKAALEKIRKEKTDDIICYDNCVDVMVDTECPYGTFDEDKPKRYEVTIFNRFNPDERESVTVLATSQDEAEENAIGNLLDGWGVLESREV